MQPPPAATFLGAGSRTRGAGHFRFGESAQSHSPGARVAADGDYPARAAGRAASSPAFAGAKQCFAFARLTARCGVRPRGHSRFTSCYAGKPRVHILCTRSKRCFEPLASRPERRHPWRRPCGLAWLAPVLGSRYGCKSKIRSVLSAMFFNSRWSVPSAAASENSRRCADRKSALPPSGQGGPVGGTSKRSQARGQPLFSTATRPGSVSFAPFLCAQRKGLVVGARKPRMNYLVAKIHMREGKISPTATWCSGP